MEKKTKRPTTPIINLAGMDLLERSILQPSAPAANKPHDQLVWDECKRYILSCIQHNFKVEP